MPTLIPLATSTKAHLVELFVSVQGEGPWVGERQLFVRFLGCNLDCLYCDAPETKTKQPTCRVEREPGTWEFDYLPNPFSLDALQTLVHGLAEPTDIHSIAITGGEPLLHHKFLAEWIPMLRNEGYRTYLETSGELDERMAKVAEWVDFCAMDIKLPSSSGERPMWAEHRRFLAVCREHEIPTFAKAVVGANSTFEEIEETARLAAEVWPEVVLVLQPVTPFGAVTEAPTVAQMLGFQAVALRLHRNVRIIPQTHKMLGAL